MDKRVLIRYAREPPGHDMVLHKMDRNVGNIPYFISKLSYTQFTVTNEHDHPYHSV